MGRFSAQKKRVEFVLQITFSKELARMREREESEKLRGGGCRNNIRAFWQEFGSVVVSTAVGPLCTFALQRLLSVFFFNWVLWSENALVSLASFMTSFVFWAIDRKWQEKQRKLFCFCFVFFVLFCFPLGSPHRILDSGWKWSCITWDSLSCHWTIVLLSIVNRN